MPDSDETRNGLNLSEWSTLGLLSALEEEGRVTQRGLAARLGVALGLTNSLLKRAIKKGLVKVKQAPAKRFAYYVTPRGFAEKSRLVGDYLSTSLSFFRQSREEYAAIFDAVEAGDGVVLFGVGELAEIALLSAREKDIEPTAIVHPGSNLAQFSGLSVTSSLDALPEDYAGSIVLCGVEQPQDSYDVLVKRFGEERVYAPPLLHITRNANRGDQS